MNAGVIGTLLRQLPYQFPGLQVLSTIAFTVDLVLYVVFSVIYILHFVMFRQQAYYELVGSVLDLCLLPCWSIAWMTLVSFVTLTVSDASWGGHPFTIVACVMWWIAAAWMFGMLFFAFFTLIQQHTILDRQLPTLIIIPAVGVSTLAVVGGLVSSFSHGISARLAVPIIIMSICAVGVGILLGLILYTYLFHQLLAKGWPLPPQTATLFMLVGPMGQSAAALQLLGSAANTHGQFRGYNEGIFLTETAASSLQVTCILLALLMTGFGAVWLVFAILAMLDRAYHRQLVWAPTWNAIIFPTGTLATSTLLLGTDLDSPFFRVMTVILLLFLILVFFINVAFSLWKIFKGELLIVREDHRVKEQLKEG
jgi:tellurite resistance protein TehA-like permease